MDQKMSMLQARECPLMISFNDGKTQVDDLLAAARPCRIEKLETEAVIDAKLICQFTQHER